MGTLIPEYWISNGENGKLFDVAKGSEEWERLTEMVINTISPLHKNGATAHKINFKSFTVTRIERLENLFLWLGYNARKDLLSKSAPFKPLPNVHLL